jgi:type I restriction enzyme, R subunit
VLYSGFDASAVDKAQAKIKDFRAWIQDHKSELTALQALYAGTPPLKLSLKDLRHLRDAFSRPPIAATPIQLWRAFQAVEPDSAKGSGGEVLTDLVTLVRHALVPAFSLVPYREALRERYEMWLQEREADETFTTEQREWLDRTAEHIATSLAIEPDDFESGWFGQHGSVGRAHVLFGDKLMPLIADLNDRLAA